MFTGIVTHVGRLRAAKDQGGKRRFEVETAYDTAGLDLGASVSHSGCCLTVVDKGPGWFAVGSSPMRRWGRSTLAPGKLRRSDQSRRTRRAASATNWAAISFPAMWTGWAR